MVITREPTVESRRLWQAFAMAGLASIVLYICNLSPEFNLLAFAVIGIGGVWACCYGPYQWGAQIRAGWLLGGLCALALLVDVVGRPFLIGHPFPVPLLATGAALPGYVLLGTVLVMVLRARAGIERHAVLDSVLICLAAGLACTLLLVMPAWATPGHPVTYAVVAAGLPFLDVLLLVLVAHLTFTASPVTACMRALLGMAAALFVGDLLYAIIGANDRQYGSPLLAVPFLVAFVLLGVAALHPSAAVLHEATRSPVPAWSVRRLALLVPAVLSPFVLAPLVGGRSATDRWSIAATGVVLVTILLLRAVSAATAAPAQATHPATHDPLTGLPNRQRITREVERLVNTIPAESTERAWVFLLDLDDFQWVNESFGHDAGDQLLIEVATRLRAALPARTMLARIDADQFLLAYEGTRANALRLVDEVRGCFTRPMDVHGQELTVTASVGIAYADGAGEAADTAEALLRDADTAMHRSKAQGPGRSTLFDTSMHDRVRERIELQHELAHALADDQLHVVFQPIMRLATGRPLGAEAQLRWQHPQRGDIAPSMFLPIAHESGLIDSIGAWARDEALRQFAQWRADAIVTDDFQLSINLSPRELHDPQLPAMLAAELHRHGVPGRAVSLELTESVLVEGSSITGRVLSELRALGVKLLVDDFGTGYSALGYLRTFPVSGVKIDRTFVSGLGSHPQDEAIVRAVVAMGDALGLTIAADGVETRAQRDSLLQAGVTRGQGWLWGPAVRAPEFASRWHADGTVIPPVTMHAPAGQLTSGRQ